MPPLQKHDQKIIWVTPKWPFPITDGARIATTQLIKNLAYRGLDIHLISLVPENEEIKVVEAKSELGVNEVTIIRRPAQSRLQQLFNFIRAPFIPITLFAYAKASIGRKIARIAKTDRADLVVYDGLHAAAWKLASSADCAQSFSEAYRAHNVESDIWFRAAKEAINPVKKLLLKLQGKLIYSFEQKLARHSAFVFPVSNADENIFRSYIPKGRLETLPIGIQIHRAEPTHLIDDEKLNVLFIGKLDWAPNRDGLKWVLDRVWPKVSEKRADLALTIVGSGDRSWLEPYRNLAGVKIVGLVDQVAPYYQSCVATIVPVFYGSGTRVKAIESSLYGKMCISTEIGVEGMGLTPGEHYHRAEVEDDWIEALAQLQRPIAEKIGNQAAEHARSHFDPVAIADRFIQSISWRQST